MHQSSSKKTEEAPDCFGIVLVTSGPTLHCFEVVPGLPRTFQGSLFHLLKMSPTSYAGTAGQGVCAKCGAGYEVCE